MEEACDLSPDNPFDADLVVALAGARAIGWNHEWWERLDRNLGGLSGS